MRIRDGRFGLRAVIGRISFQRPVWGASFVCCARSVGILALEKMLRYAANAYGNNSVLDGLFCPAAVEKASAVSIDLATATSVTICTGSHYLELYKNDN